MDARSVALIALTLAALAPPLHAQSVDWRSVRWGQDPGYDAIAGGPGSDPSPHAPLYVCRARVQGSLTPGKWVKGNCNAPYDGRETVNREFEVAYGNGGWRAFGSRRDRGLVRAGNEADGTPLFACRVRYLDGLRDAGWQPGKIVADGTCHIGYGGREVTVRGPFDALYSGRGNSHAGLDKPLCRVVDPGVHLWMGVWSGPDCTAVDTQGNPVADPPRNPILPDNRPRDAARNARQVDPPEAPKPPRGLCKKGDPGVSETIWGVTGPDCITSDLYGDMSMTNDATDEEKAAIARQQGEDAENKAAAEAKQREEDANKRPCKLSTFGVRRDGDILKGDSCVDAPAPPEPEAPKDDEPREEPAPDAPEPVEMPAPDAPTDPTEPPAGEDGSD